MPTTAMLALSKIGALCFLCFAISAAYYSELLQKELLRDGADMDSRQTPMNLGVRLPNGSVQILIPENATPPLRRANIFEARCTDAQQELHFSLCGKPGDSTFVLHRETLPCPAGLQARIEQTVELDNDGVWFGVVDVDKMGEGSEGGRQREHVMTFQEFLAISRSLATRDGGSNGSSDSQTGELALQQELHALRSLRQSQGGIATDRESFRACLKDRKALQERVTEAKRASEHWRLHAEKKDADLQRLGQKTKELQGKIKTLKAKMGAQRNQTEEKQTLETILEMKSEELKHRRQEAKWWSVATAVVAGSSALAFFTWKRYASDDLSLDAKKERRKLLRLLGRVKAKSETPSPTKTLESPADNQDSNPVDDQVFQYTVELEHRRNRDVRCVRIQCPGVQEADVAIKVVFNGVEVYIDRQETAGLPSVSWKHRFIFPAEEGHFAFADDETRLSHGLLELVFVPQDFLTRTFRFPEHFDLAYDD